VIAVASPSPVRPEEAGPAASSRPRASARSLPPFAVARFAHPQGCCSYLLADERSGQAMAIDPHLDLVEDMARHLRERGWSLPYVLDTHVHADHPSGAAALAARFGSTRLAHASSPVRGVTRHLADGERVHLGDAEVSVVHAPGHTPDHVVVVAGGALFSGDTLHVGGVARTDFQGGDAERLRGSLLSLTSSLPEATVLFPGHAYAGPDESTLGAERRENPWLRILETPEFARRLREDPPPEPANMADLVAANLGERPIPEALPASEAVRRVAHGGAGSVVDVRSGVEFDTEHVPGSRHVPLDESEARADEVRAVPAPRWLLCRTGARAAAARERLAAHGIGALVVVEGGIEAYRAAGGLVESGPARVSLERQVRMVAGALVLLGCALAAIVDPLWLALPAFVGAGQVFAGATDRCGMGLLLARTPWNRRPGRGAAAPPPACAAVAPPAACAAPPPRR
jgi:glyoxylase-like metal-dependent hydrolase (beta-lactamase superfamily II)